MAVARIYDDVFLGSGPQWHYDSPRRLEMMHTQLRDAGLWSQMRGLNFTPADDALLGLFHDSTYVDEIRMLSEIGGEELDHETLILPSTFGAASSAVGAACAAVDAVTGPRFDSAICFVRPPGHQALPDRAIGGCIFNSVAIAAEHALQLEGIRRVAIVDFDVRHGTGVQNHFFNRRDVLYVSLHQQSLPPGSGLIEEIGIDAGLGYNINFPLPTGTTDAHMLRCCDRIVIPVLQSLFVPDIILVAGGFGGHWADETTDLCMTAHGYHAMMHRLCTAADATAEGRLCFILEGGWGLDYVGQCAENTVRAMLGQPRSTEDDHTHCNALQARDLDDRIDAIIQFHEARMERS